MSIEVSRELLQRTLEALGAGSHLIRKYTPDHHWLNEHEKRIAELKAVLDDD